MWTLISKRTSGVHFPMLPGIDLHLDLAALSCFQLLCNHLHSACDVTKSTCYHGRFATEAGKLSLLRVLRAYAVYDPEVGYCQGMNFLAGLLLTWMPNEATAFGGLVVLMQQRMLRDLYKSDLAKLQVCLACSPTSVASDYALCLC